MSKAIVINECNNLNGVRVVEDHLLSELENDQIEVKVSYVGLNFADIYMQCGLGYTPIPFVPGIECSGTVTKVTTQQSDFKVGDCVICYNYKGGMLREILRVPASQCYKIPNGIDLKTAAALFVNYLTAYYALFKLGHLQPQENIFVSSCAGGVGLAAVQLSKTVPNVGTYGTCSSDKSTFMTSLGVNCLPHDFAKLEEEITLLLPQGFDIVLESQSTASRQMLSKHLNDFARVIILGAKDMVKNETNSNSQVTEDKIDPVELIFGNYSISGLHLGVLCEKQPHLIHSTLDFLFKLLQEGKIRPVISNCYKFDQFVDAFNEMSQRKNIGKIIIQVQ